MKHSHVNRPKDDNSVGIERTLQRTHIIRRAIKLREKGQTDRAIKILCRGLQNDPDNLAYVNQLYFIHFHLRNQYEAQKYLEISYRLDPFNPSTAIHLGQVYIQRGELDKAEGVLTKSHHLAP